MFPNSSKILFFLILLLGSLITVSANSWLGAWMGLEINLLSFIPLMNDIKNLKSSEASLKYFLTQAFASSILLFAMIMYMLKLNLLFQLNLENSFNKMMIMSSLLLKSGTAPFHFWFPEVMEGLSWNNALILMTWQKLAPLMLISYIMMETFIIIIIIITITTGALSGLNQTSLRKIMAFSSINHLGWLLSAMLLNENIWMIYFSFYVFLSMSIVLLFNLMKIFHFNQLFSMFLNSKYLKMAMMINLLSLGGLPPFMGFFPKWMVIQYLSMNSQMFMVVLLISMTLITLYFYLRLCFSAFMLNYYENNWMIAFKFNNFKLNLTLTMSFISTFGLPLFSMIYMML
uniref:NADH-ubiquinone oxidoreductase chain 2 n=1 Tax=Xanthochlorus tibetensis TaxID=2779315 RepID=A0A7U3RS61_9MUSC|nr:NADH dehydrogenase subunit 2 [Xanthochlorus tibetensis]QOL12450.1 NADH dehydrogenase subunit 2 [Xanthochlorus tibetensis]